MQFDGSMADLAACSHNPPPRTRPESQQKALIHWGSLLLLAQEAIYGRGPDPMEMSTEGGRTRSSQIGQQGSSILTGGRLTMGSDTITRSLFSNAGVTEEIKATTAENSAVTVAAQYDRKSSKKGGPKKKSKGSKPMSSEKSEAARQKTLSRVHQVISQNATLRRELIRMRGALEMERETLRRLEMAEDEADADQAM